MNQKNTPNISSSMAEVMNQIIEVQSKQYSKVYNNTEKAWEQLRNIVLPVTTLFLTGWVALATVSKININNGFFGNYWDIFIPCLLHLFCFFFLAANSYVTMAGGMSIISSLYPDLQNLQTVKNYIQKNDEDKAKELLLQVINKHNNRNWFNSYAAFLNKFFCHAMFWGLVVSTITSIIFMLKIINL